LNHVLPFHCYSIWDFTLRVRQSGGETKKVQGSPAVSIYKLPKWIGDGQIRDTKREEDEYSP